MTYFKVRKIKLSIRGMSWSSTDPENH